MKPSNKFLLYGIEIFQVPKKEIKYWESLIVKSRTDLVEEQTGVNEYYELDNGNILEVLLAFSAHDRILRIYKNEEDLLKMRNALNEEFNNLKKFDNKTYYEIISFRETEIADIKQTSKQILAGSLKIQSLDLNYSVESLKYLNKPFMRVIGPQQRENNPLIKALLCYLAETMHQYMPGSKVEFRIDSGIVSAINVIDRENQVFNADMDLFEVWTEGALTDVENDDGKKKKGRLTMEILFNVETGKHKHSFKSKPSDLFRQE